ncbi:hypothetical protein XENOCAPTIV_029619 [Xenoophorus captivus]|uniref:Uncharacterized protein n=1 Tax=Xenoophorus captivus TaxID=1517983 RepID=A0ABV0R5I7_9TELE
MGGAHLKLSSGPRQGCQLACIHQKFEQIMFRVCLVCRDVGCLFPDSRPPVQVLDGGKIGTTDLSSQDNHSLESFSVKPLRNQRCQMHFIWALEKRTGLLFKVLFSEEGKCSILFGN